MSKIKDLLRKRKEERESEGTGSSPFPYFLFPNGKKKVTYTVRFLADVKEDKGGKRTVDEDDLFYIYNRVHGSDKQYKLRCPKSAGLVCPLCDKVNNLTYRLANDIWDIHKEIKDDNEDTSDTTYTRLRMKQGYEMYGVIIEADWDKEGKFLNNICQMTYSKTTFNMIEDLFTKKRRPNDFWVDKTGREVIFTITQDGDKRTWSLELGDVIEITKDGKMLRYVDDDKDNIEVLEATCKLADRPLITKRADFYNGYILKHDDILKKIRKAINRKEDIDLTPFWLGDVPNDKKDAKKILDDIDEDSDEIDDHNWGEKKQPKKNKKKRVKTIAKSLTDF